MLIFPDISGFPMNLFACSKLVSDGKAFPDCRFNSVEIFERDKKYFLGEF